MTNDEIRKLLELEARATPAPWEMVGTSLTDWGREFPNSMSMEWIPNGRKESNSLHQEDGALMVAARNAIRPLAEEVPAARERIAELEAAGKVLMQFVVDEAGYGHDDDCPLDDTCDCSKKPRNDALNAACRVIEGRT